MQYRELGKTGIKVSRLGLGTACFGMDYGMDKKVDKESAQDIINLAYIHDIKLFDVGDYGTRNFNFHKSPVLRKVTKINDVTTLEIGGFVGMSVYTVPQAIDAIMKKVEFISVPYNLLYQEMADIFEFAKNRDVGIIARSVFARGLLTPKAEPFTAEVPRWEGLARYALRFVLNNPLVDCVLIGVHSVEELRSAIKEEANA